MVRYNNRAQKGPAVNKNISSKTVRVISEKGDMIGVLEREKALKLAFDQGLDLVEVSPNATPPVCKIIDYGKYKYQVQKKQAEAKKKQKTFEVKEVKFRPGIEDHDYTVKLKSIQRFLSDGDKVKIVRFGDPNMKIKKNIPGRRKNFRARHNCDNPGPKTKARYWSCKNW